MRPFFSDLGLQFLVAIHLSKIFDLKPNAKKTEMYYMSKVKEKKSLDIMKKNVEHLRYRLAKYQIVGIAPPVNLLIELKMAESILKVELMDTMRVNIKNINHIDFKA
jgi:hypothetical protein